MYLHSIYYDPPTRKSKYHRGIMSLVRHTCKTPMKNDHPIVVWSIRLRILQMYMRACALLDLLNEVRKRDKMRGLLGVNRFFDVIYKFNSTGARV